VNIIGISQSIIWFCDCCLGSGLGKVVIFCCTHIVPPTRIGKIKYLSGVARSSQRKWLPRGTSEKTGDQEA
jgi:hypothetical protein